jgi:hypothetical protein
MHAPEMNGSPMPIIVGAPRSGTTLLRFMLDAHPVLAIPPETGFLASVAAQTDAISPIDLHHTVTNITPTFPDGTTSESMLKFTSLVCARSIRFPLETASGNSTGCMWQSRVRSGTVTRLRCIASICKQFRRCFQRRTSFTSFATGAT